MSIGDNEVIDGQCEKSVRGQNKSSLHMSETKQASRTVRTVSATASNSNPYSRWSMTTIGHRLEK